MEPNQFVSKARSAARYGLSDKLRNAGDGLIWPTEGRKLALAGLRCGRLMVGQIMASTTPRQQTPITGQVLPYNHEMLQGITANG
jgi:hypothetical protein